MKRGSRCCKAMDPFKKTQHSAVPCWLPTAPPDATWTSASASAASSAGGGGARVAARAAAAAIRELGTTSTPPLDVSSARWVLRILPFARARAAARAASSAAGTRCGAASGDVDGDAGRNGAHPSTRLTVPSTHTVGGCWRVYYRFRPFAGAKSAQWCDETTRVRCRMVMVVDRPRPMCRSVRRGTARYARPPVAPTMVAPRKGPLAIAAALLGWPIFGSSASRITGLVMNAVSAASAPSVPSVRGLGRLWPPTKQNRGYVATLIVAALVAIFVTSQATRVRSCVLYTH